MVMSLLAMRWDELGKRVENLAMFRRIVRGSLSVTGIVNCSQSAQTTNRLELLARSNITRC